MNKIEDIMTNQVLQVSKCKKLKDEVKNHMLRFVPEQYLKYLQDCD